MTQFCEYRSRVNALELRPVDHQLTQNVCYELNASWNIIDLFDLYFMVLQQTFFSKFATVIKLLMLCWWKNIRPTKLIHFHDLINKKTGISFDSLFEWLLFRIDKTKNHCIRCKTGEPIDPFGRIFRELIRNALTYFLPMHPSQSEAKDDDEPK